jgi:hypothetical protein
VDLVVDVFDELEVRVELIVEDFVRVRDVVVFEEDVDVDRVELNVVEDVLELAVVEEVEEVEPVVGSVVEVTVEMQSSAPSPFASGPATGFEQTWLEGGLEEIS